jgi:aminoglycoside phosphotransferase
MHRSSPSELSNLFGCQFKYSLFTLARTLQSQSLKRFIQDAFLLRRRRRPCCCSKQRQRLHRCSRSPHGYDCSPALGQQNRDCLGHRDCDCLQDVLPVRHEVHKRHQDLYRHSANLGHSHQLPEQVHRLLPACQAKHRSHRTCSS